ncbi:hypothetical protein FDECE_11578, partial [Fusarium decemcellulare]
MKVTNLMSGLLVAALASAVAIPEGADKGAVAPPPDAAHPPPPHAGGPEKRGVPP